MGLRQEVGHIPLLGPSVENPRAPPSSPLLHTNHYASHPFLPGTISGTNWCTNPRSRVREWAASILHTALSILLASCPSAQTGYSRQSTTEPPTKQGGQHPRLRRRWRVHDRHCTCACSVCCEWPAVMSVPSHRGRQCASGLPCNRPSLCVIMHDGSNAQPRFLAPYPQASR